MSARTPDGSPRIVVTGIGWVTPLGHDIETVWKRLLNAESGMAPTTRGEIRDCSAELDEEEQAALKKEEKEEEEAMRRLREDAERRAKEAEDALEAGRRVVEVQGLETKRVDLMNVLELQRRELRESPVRLRAVREINDVVARVAGLAEASGLEVSELAPGAASTSGRLAVVPVKLAAGGAYGDVMAFLEAVKDQVPELAVQRAQVEAERQGDARATVSRTRLKVEFAWYAAPVAAGSAAGTAKGGTGQP
jgi:Tfp pilus assembly protein PilO